MRRRRFLSTPNEFLVGEGARAGDSWNWKTCQAEWQMQSHWNCLLRCLLAWATHTHSRFVELAFLLGLENALPHFLSRCFSALGKRFTSMLLSVDVTNSQGTTQVMWFWSYHNFIHGVVTFLLSLHYLCVRSSRPMHYYLKSSLICLETYSIFNRDDEGLNLRYYYLLPEMCKATLF